MTMHKTGEPIENVYVYFSCRRPKESQYAFFAVALFAQPDGRILLHQETRQLKCWSPSAYVTAIQSYENALYTIYKNQAALKARGVKQIYLATKNVTLMGYIQEPKKCRFADYMEAANRDYIVDGPRELEIPVGLLRGVTEDKARKYCGKDYVVNKVYTKKDRALKIDASKAETVYDQIEDYTTKVHGIEKTDEFEGSVTIKRPQSEEKSAVYNEIGQVDIDSLM